MNKNLHLEDRTWTFSDIESHPLCKMYGLTAKAARRSLAAGRLNGSRPGGLVWRFNDADIRAWIDNARSDAQR